MAICYTVTFKYVCLCYIATPKLAPYDKTKKSMTLTALG